MRVHPLLKKKKRPAEVGRPVAMLAPEMAGLMRVTRAMRVMTQGQPTQAKTRVSMQAVLMQVPSIQVDQMLQ